MKKIAIAIVILISVTSLTACQKEEKQASSTTPNSSVQTSAIDYKKSATDFVDMLTKSDFESCISEFSSELEKALPKTKLEEAWVTTIKDCGTFKTIEKVESEQKSDLEVITVFAAFEKNGVTTVISYDKSGKIGGLWFNYYEPEANKSPVPSGITETDVTVGEGTKWSLEGKITQKGEQSDVAVVLVHGSGPSDMDETIYQNKPFRDIAWGLAEQGIDTLRYDKRTFAYANKMTPEEVNKLTVEEETIQDAIAALTLLQNKGYKSVYLAGHSLGAMLAPRIQQESGDKFAGLILLAGSPRTLTDIIIDQNVAAIAALTDKGQISESNKIVASEKEKLAKINELSEEELLTTTVFGMPSIYIKDLVNSDTAAIAKKITVPMYILQGSKDFQVYPDKDYPLWQELFKDKSNVVFRLFEGLNHLFMESKGAGTGTVEEYKTQSTVDKTVIDSIASFIKDTKQ